MGGHENRDGLREGVVSSVFLTFSGADNIYEHDATSEQVYVDTAQGIVRAACEGFNGTIFAYGQTSSGKTFTMYGSAEQKGVIPLAVEETFDLISSVSFLCHDFLKGTCHHTTHPPNALL